MYSFSCTSYTGSLYASLASLIAVEGDKLTGKRGVLFSYGSGLAATMFSVRFEGSVERMRTRLDIPARLEQRRSVSAVEYTAALALREKTHSLKDFTPSHPVEDLFPGTYYLKHVDSLKRRTYAQKKH